MISLFKSVAGILVPRYSKTHGIPCGFCRMHIFKEHEAGGVIRYKDGKPICARDRILQGNMGATIIADKGKRDAQVAKVEDKLQKRANAEALEIAEITQTQTGTKRKRK